MKTVQVSRRSTQRRRLLAAGALSAVVALSHVDSAAAVACAANTYYDGTTKTGPGATATFDPLSDCTACTGGTTAAATPDGSARTYCEGVAPGYYGAAGNVATAHAVATVCGTGYVSTAGQNAAREDCFKYFAGNPVASTVSGVHATLNENVQVFVKTAATSSGGVLKLHLCPGGTEQASAVTLNLDDTTSNAASFCTKISADHYGTAGSATAHATPTPCPFGGTLAASTATNAVTACTPSCSATAAFATDAATKTCVCALGFYGSAVDSNGLTAGAAAGGCTACPGTGYTSVAGAAANREDCTLAVTSGSEPTNGDEFLGFIKTTGNSAAGVYTVNACPEGTETATAITIAATTGSNAATKCEKISANYYGTAGSATAHATPTACPYGGTSTASTTTNAVTACTPSASCAGASNAIVVKGKCVCESNYFGIPIDGNGLTVGAAASGCTACPFGGVSVVGSNDAIDTCTPDCGYAGIAVARQGSCACAANFNGEPKDSSNAALAKVASGCAKCPANSNSLIGSDACTCDDGYIPALGGSTCQPFAATAAASPTAASPTADSAGASTPIAVALAAAAAVPLLL